VRLEGHPGPERGLGPGHGAAQRALLWSFKRKTGNRFEKTGTQTPLFRFYARYSTASKKRLSKGVGFRRASSVRQTADYGRNRQLEVYSMFIALLQQAWRPVLCFVI
jgi:hypothetical protein